MERVKLAAVISKYREAGDDKDKLIALNTIENILQKNLDEARELKDQLLLRSKFRRFRNERAARLATKVKREQQHI
jgi:hypothetical protein